MKIKRWKNLFELHGIPIVRILYYENKDHYVVLEKALKGMGTCNGCCLKKVDNCGLVCDVSMPFDVDRVPQLYHAKFVHAGDVLESETGNYYRLVKFNEDGHLRLEEDS